MKGLIAWAVLGCLLLAACPGDRSQSQTGGPSPGRYAEYADLFKRQAGFEAELKRLQELSAGDPNLAGVSTGSAQLQYKLGMRVGKDRIGAVVRDNSSGAEHVLWVWEDTVGDQGMPKMIDQQANSGGMSVEYQLDNDIFLSLSLRWVQDRYLEVKRTFEAGGLDMEYEMGSGYTSWSLESDPLPYRLSPGIEGPFGIVNKERADGGWYGAAYPRDMMLPAVAAFDQSGGLLLAISDEHPRRLDREYGVWWRLTGRQHDPDDNVQLKIDYGIYNSTVDRTTDPVLLSGLPQRDSVVLEPFSLVATGMEDSFMAGTTEQVAGHMSDFVAAFHARYAAEEPQAKHLMLVLDGLERDSTRLDGILRLKTGLWNVQDLLLPGDPDELPE
ncbi:MAG: hypothetical protein OEZ09_16240, partial [Betaproteobacteria bacterium]|nr:hypothetical protein [Betaproteobacteria bacterium]